MPREDARTRAGPMAQPRLKGPVKVGQERRQGSCSGPPSWRGGPQAQPGAGMGRIVRGPQGPPAGRALSLPHPPHGNPSPHSPNVVGPQRDLQFPEHLRGLLNSPLKLGAKNRGSLMGGAPGLRQQGPAAPHNWPFTLSRPHHLHTTAWQNKHSQTIRTPPTQTHRVYATGPCADTKEAHQCLLTCTHTHTRKQRILTHSNMNTLGTHTHVHIH